jgi:hypothetical protein
MPETGTATSAAERMRAFRERQKHRSRNDRAMVEAARDLCYVLRHVAMLGNADAAAVVSEDDVQCIVALSNKFLATAKRFPQERKKAEVKKGR